VTIPFGSGTIGELINLSERAEICARDFYLAMLESFIHVEEAAATWRALMLWRSRRAGLLAKLMQSVPESELTEPADPGAVRWVQDALKVLSPDRVDAIQTLSEAHDLASEFENSGGERAFMSLVVRYAAGSSVRRDVVVDRCEQTGMLTALARRDTDLHWMKTVYKFWTSDASHQAV
jgi:hypothetical protein